MPTFRANTAVDPQQIASSFDSIAKMFAPPTGQELYAGARAAETRQKVQQIADLYARAGSTLTPTQQAVLDQQAGIAGAYSPNQSLTAVDRNGATTVQTNAADNARALQQTTMQQQGDTTRTMLAPVGEGATRFVPPSIASAFGVPQQQVGAVKVNEGQQAALPDGRTVMGTPKPMTEDQAKAQDYQRLDPAVRNAIVFGSTPVESVQTPGGPRIASRLDAIGQTPAITGDTKVTNYRDPATGRAGTARVEGGKLVDTQTGEVLPAGIEQYSNAVTGKKDEVLGASAKSNIETQLLDMSNLEQSVNSLDKIATNNPQAIGLTGQVLGIGQDAMATMKEAATMFGPKAQDYLKQVENGTLPPEMSRYFNPNIPQATLLENTILAQYAKMQDPNGRLSNQQMEIASKALGIDGMLKSADKTKAVIAGIRQQIAQKRAMLGPSAPGANAIRPPDAAGGPAPAAPAGGDATFVRGPDGKLVRAH